MRVKGEHTLLPAKPHTLHPQAKGVGMELFISNALYILGT